MSQINFDNLINKHPQISWAIQKLQVWVQSKDDLFFIDPKDLAREVRSVDALSLLAVLSLLVQEGELKIVYKVLTPSGTFTDGEYEDPSEVPDRLPDRFNRYFETSEFDTVPIYRKVA